MTELLSLAIDAGVEVTAVVAPHPWGEVDDADDLALYERDPRFAPLRRELRALTRPLETT